MTQNSTELILRDLKKKRTSILKQLSDVELGHLYAGRPLDSIINAYITLYEALEDEVQNFQDEVKLMKVNQGLGLQK
jgi:Mg2+ and Co2+ transporter CorA